MVGMESNFSPRAVVSAAHMTITPGETPRLANAAESKVYQALVEQLQPNDRVIPGQRVTDHLKDHEVDFVVAIEGAGIVSLEVKGGEVWHDGDTWWRKRRGHEHKIKPVRQAREACYSLREFIENDDRWTQGRLRWDHVIALPNAEIADDFACRSARGGKSSTATTSPLSSTSWNTSSSNRNSTGHCSLGRASTSCQLR